MLRLKVQIIKFKVQISKFKVIISKFKVIQMFKTIDFRALTAILLFLLALLFSLPNLVIAIVLLLVISALLELILPFSFTFTLLGVTSSDIRHDSVDRLGNRLLSTSCRCAED